MEKKNYTAEDMIAFLQARGIIDTDGIAADMQKEEKLKAVAPYLDKIRKLCGKDGRWEVKVPDQTKKDKRRCIRAQTREQLIDKIYAWQIKDKPMNPDEITLRDLYEPFVKYKSASDWTEPTLIRNKIIWDKYYADSYIIDVAISQIDVTDLKTWAYKLIRDHHMTRKEWMRTCTWMRQMLRYAEIKGIIDKNLYGLLEIAPKEYRTPTERPDEQLVLSPDEEMALYGECWKRYKGNKYPKNYLLPIAVILLCQIGCRPCELVAIKYSDVQDGEITIQRYFSEKRDKVLDDHTKAGYGPRTIPLTSLAMELIELAHKRNPKGEYLFITGSMISFYNRLRKTFRSLCGDDKTPYSARRTFVSSLIDKKVSIRDIQKFVGHKKPSTTYDFYQRSHKSITEKRRELEEARVPNCTHISDIEKSLEASSPKG